MTQKTLPILGTVCAISIVLLGFMAGCKKKDVENKEAVSQSTAEERSDKKDESGDAEHKKDISFSTADKDDVKSESASSEGSDKELKDSGDKDKKEEDSSKKEDYLKKEPEESSKTSKADIKDGKRVALVEEALKNMGSSLSDRAHAKVDALEDVILA